MYICPTCFKEFNTEQAIQKHFLACWKEQHPYHKSKNAHRSEDIITRKIDDNVLNFFNALEENNGRSID